MQLKWSVINASSNVKQYFFPFAGHTVQVFFFIVLHPSSSIGHSFSSENCQSASYIFIRYSHYNIYNVQPQNNILVSLTNNNSFDSLFNFSSRSSIILFQIILINNYEYNFVASQPVLHYHLLESRLLHSSYPVMVASKEGRSVY